MKVSKRILAAVLCLLIMMSTITLAFAGSVSASTKKNAESIAKQMEAEGIVLLKNENNALPLTDKKVNVFGMGSISFALGGGGSGSVVAENAISFYQGLENAGIKYNEELLNFYEEWAKKHSIAETGQGLVDMLLQMLNSKIQQELPAENLTPSILKNAKDFSDTAIFVITRTGAEMADLTPDDIKITDTEKAIIKKLDRNFRNVIVIFNTCNILELDWINDCRNVNAVMLAWTPGEFGADSIGKVLSGEINPSGKLVDTVAYNISDYPTTANFGNFAYSDQVAKYFVNYAEGIYVGYRYFETFAPNRVLFPFGYGLSYTSFDWEVTDYSADSNKISVTVKVTNTGEYAGKDVVQLYFSAPYYSGGIEKSSVELAGYAKTKLIAPGHSDKVTITFDTDDMASYDYKNRQAWVLDAGTYQIKVGHTVRDFEAVYNYEVPTTKVIKNDDTTGVEIKNHFDNALGSFHYLSRTDGLYSKPSAPTDFLATQAVKDCDTRPLPTTEGVIQNTGVVYEDGAIMLADVAADNSLWDKFLDQFTVEEMIDMICESGYKTLGLERLGVPTTVDNDGPATVKGEGGLLYKESGIAYPVAFALASSWNDDLAYAYGESVGREAKELGTHIWYAPACNLHRSPMGGRNFEYYSEDPLLSGKMAAAVTRGAQSQKLVVTVKHFVCNDQETNRQTRGLFTWTNEQAMRELYLEPFEIAVKEGKAWGIMSAYNRIGADWCSGNKALITDLLRTEWGFDGFVVSDAYINVTGANYMDPVLATYARNDACLTSLWYFAEKLQMTTNMKQTYEKDPIGFGNALRLCTYDLCRVKMRTLAFDPTQTTGHRGEGKIVSKEHGNVDNSTGGANQGGSITDTNGAQNNANKVEKADIAKTGFKTYSLVGAAAVAVTAAIVIPVCIKKRKRED